MSDPDLNRWTAPPDDNQSGPKLLLEPKALEDLPLELLIDSRRHRLQV